MRKGRKTSIARESTADLRAQLDLQTRERNEALERQTATADVLKVISRSAFDLQAVLDTLVESAARLCEAEMAFIHRREGEQYRAAATFGFSPEFWAFMQGHPISPGRGSIAGRVALERRAIQIEDVAVDPEYTLSQATSLAGQHTTLGVPLLRENELVGVIVLARQRVELFTEKQIALVTTFADQAVIAIENVRLFDEVQAKTRDLEEALRYQTGSANILNVIASSPTDVGPALKAIVESACEICGAYDAALHLKDGGGDLLFSAHHGPIPFDWDSNKRPINRHWTVGRAILDKQPVMVSDFVGPEGDEFPEGREMARKQGHRCTLSVPLLAEGEAIGAIALRRLEPVAFSDKQTALLQTFADQAVIAIENARLFNDTKEALAHQTASAEVLQVIGKSMADAGPVFERIVDSLERLFEHKQVGIFLAPGDGLLHMVAGGGTNKRTVLSLYPRPIEQTAAPAVLDARRQVYYPDVLHGADAPDSLRRVAEAAGNFSDVLTPMLWEGRGVGMIAVTREPNVPFSERELSLLRTFADQAVIAIENARLFGEVQAKTHELQESLQQQTATADVLKVISRSTFDLQTVLQTLVESAAKLSDADKATITRQRDGVFYRAESYGFSDEFMNYVRTVPIVPDRSSATSRALLKGTIVHIPDVKADTEYTFNEARRLGDFRAILAVPMLREGTPVGVIVLTRTEPRAFTEKQIDVVATFADQAAIAIENVRLFENVDARTRELQKSLEDLRTAQDRLIQTEKLASLGQLTAGIAHEIKNPLNFVNNFSALSAELVDEMNGVLEDAKLDQKRRAELDEIRQLLKSNLEKVVQHGKRADSIVKNMLLHSRSGSGEHRAVEINAIVEESLNLAYHGARAEGRDFNITLERDLDPDVGFADIYPQEITRVLLNLISNGFYAATRRAMAVNGFQPKLTAVTHNRGDNVEIRIRDNGTGISPEIREKIFNPFFTTKPAGEGTGLGLSMSHDIVVKQHGGTIDVVTEPGSFTEFIITLPRNTPAQAEAGGGDEHLYSRGRR